MSLDPMSVEKAYSYQQYLEENMELRKIVSKQETLLLREREEKYSLQKIHEDFKTIHDKTRKEIQELNTKLLSSFNEKMNLEKKFEQELQRQKTYFDKQKEAYEEQLLKLSAYDSENIKNKIIYDCEQNFKEKLQSKDNEIETLNEQLLDFKRRIELLNTEFETMKNEAIKEIEMLKDSHKAEVRELLFKIQLLSEKSDQAIDKEVFRELKNDNELLRRQNNEYLSEINSLRREKENSILEKNDVRLTLIKELDSEKMKNKILEADYDRNNHVLKNLEYELSYVKSKLDEKNDEIRLLLEEKFLFAKQLKDKELDFEAFKAEIKVLRQKMDERDKEFNESMYVSSEKEKQQFLQERQEKETLMKQIETLSLDLKENQIEFRNFYEKANEEIHTYKRDYYIISEEKRNMQQRIAELQHDLEFIREDYDRKITENSFLQKEVASVQERYRELNTKEIDNSKKLNELEVLMKKKTEELEEANKNAQNMMKMISQNSLQDSKVKDIILKKEHYKNKVLSYHFF